MKSKSENLLAKKNMWTFWWDVTASSTNVFRQQFFVYEKNVRDDNSALVLMLPYPTAEYLNNEEYFHDYYTDVEISYEASKAHPKSAIQIRNREMVDRADLILCVIERESGGAWQTVQYAIKQGKTVINLAEEMDI